MNRFLRYPSHSPKDYAALAIYAVSYMVVLVFILAPHLVISLAGAP